MRSTIAVFPTLFLLFAFVTGCEREDIEEFTPDDPITPAITISIESEEMIYVNGEEVAIEQLAEHLEEVVREEEAARAQIHAAPGVSPELIDRVEEIVYTVDGLEIDTDMRDMELM